MAAIITDLLRVNNARNFIEKIRDANRSYYTFIGLPNASEVSSSWDTSPPSPRDCFDDANTYYDTMLALKKISADDIRPVVRKIGWASATIYDMYRHDVNRNNLSRPSNKTSLYASNYYVVNSEFRVYICLNNGIDPENPNGRPSLDEPLFTDLEPRAAGTSGDGYIWKYLYTISPSDVIKFDSLNFIPLPVDWETNSVYQTVRNNAITSGQLKTVTITNRGFLVGPPNITYSRVPIRGDGTGAECTIVVNNDSKVESITVSNGGSGYTYGSVDLVGGNVPTGSTTPTFDVIIPPPGGHGEDSVVELGAFRVMINAKLSYDEGAGDFPVDNDYRRIGLITNPLKFGTEELISDLTVSATKAVIFPPTFQGNYVPDEIITQTRVVGGTNVTARARVISWNATTKLLKYYQNSVDGIFPEVTGTQNEFDGSNVISGATSGAAGQPDVNFPAVPNSSSRTINNTEYDLGMKFNNGYAKPEIKSGSGQVVYIDNRRAISRANDQVEDIKIVIEF